MNSTCIASNDLKTWDGHAHTLSMVRIDGDGARYHELALIVDGKVIETVQYRDLTDGTAAKKLDAMTETYCLRSSRDKEFRVSHRSSYDTRVKTKTYKRLKSAREFAALFTGANESASIHVGCFVIAC